MHVARARDAPLSSLFAGQEGEYRRPVVLLSYRVQDRLGVGGAVGLHVANVLLLVAVAGVGAGVALRLGASSLAALLGALLFALHPLSSASAAYVSGRGDLLVLLATAGAVAVAVGRHANTALGAFSVGFLCLVAVLSKQSGFVAGPIVVLATRLVPARNGKALWATDVAALGASVLGLAAVFPSAVGDGAAVDAALRLRHLATSVSAHAGLWLFPYGLHLDRLTPVAPPATWLLGLVAAAALVASVVVAWWRPKPGLFALASAALLYLPTSGLAPIYPAIAERWVFTGEQLVVPALLPLSFALAASLLRVARPTLAVGVVASVLLVWSPGLFERQQHLGDEASTYEATLASSPSPRACMNLGTVHLRRAAFQDSAAVLRRCTEMAPADAAIHAQLAVALHRSGRFDEASRSYARALDLDGSDARTWANAGALAARRGDFETAERRWQRALELDPTQADARRALERLRTLPRE